MFGRGQQPPVSFVFSQSIAAGATFQPLAAWEYEQPMVDGEVTLLERATAIGLVGSLKSGGDTIKQESPVPAGGTAGNTPTVFTVHPISGHSHGGLKLNLSYRNPTAGAITIDGVLTFTPGRAGAGVSRHLSGALGGGGRRGGGARRSPRRIGGAAIRAPRRRY